MAAQRDEETTPDPSGADGDDRQVGLEAAVKGIAAGIVGRAKEVAGELLEDEDLERRGIAEQEEADVRRSGGGEPRTPDGS